ncbi:cytosolic non-specific dipeptidase-like [Drosophila miranda]|uniref:cytosolic non-specific dipeptidase-like n=1 Tax=Drosophila miranda TaxID=7229 RepID=UPI00143F711C|nr:cytosolic non-specific dipeptidase-like [Drosophila miranda]
MHRHAIGGYDNLGPSEEFVELEGAEKALDPSWSVRQIPTTTASLYAQLPSMPRKKAKHFNATYFKFMFEGMEESGSEGLDDLLMERKNYFLADVDYVCISDNYWLGKKRPCLTYGLWFQLEVECATKDLHSGVFGGAVHEAPDLCYLLSVLVDKDTNILIPYWNILVILNNKRLIRVLNTKPNIDFEVAEYKKDVGVEQLPHNGDKSRLLQARWRFPSLSIHGIEGAFYEPGEKTVIPKKVIGKFSQNQKHIEECVVKYINDKWVERGSTNKMKV